MYRITKQAKKVAVIGSGMSLKGIDLSQLKNNGYIICVNDAWRNIPDCDLVITGDTKLLNKRFLDCPHKVLVCSDEPHKFDAWGDRRGMFHIKRKHENKFSDDPSLIHIGGNSGYAAFNAAYLMNPEHIFLFGIDLVNMTEHCHQHTSVGVPCPKHIATLPDNFSSTINQIVKREIKVINGSPISKIETYLKVTPEEAITRWNGLQ